MTLKIAPATRDATEYACLHWHYSHSLPSGKLFSIGVWDDDHFLGVVIFSHGANNNIGKPFNLSQYQICELTRVALRQHKGVFVSQILGKAFKCLKKFNPKIVLVVSYSDPVQGHKGGIYQATNWLYVGDTAKSVTYTLNGKKIHTRSMSSFVSKHRNLWKDFKGSQLDFAHKYWNENIKMVSIPGKHKYLMPLNKKARKRLLKYSLPYPQHADDTEKMQDISIDLSDCELGKM